MRISIGSVAPFRLLEGRYMLVKMSFRCDKDDIVD